MAKAKQLPSGRWRVRVYRGKDANGKPQYESITRNTKKEAEYAALDMELHHKEVARDSAAMTFAEAAKEYIDARRESRSPATIQGYEKMARLYFRNIEKIPLRKISQAAIQREIDAMARRLSPKSVANAHGFLNAVFAEYHPDITLRTKLPQKQKFRARIPNQNEIQRILLAVKGTEIEVPVNLAVWMGMRMSEIRALRFSCVKDDAIIVEAAIVDVDGKPVEKGTKSYAGSRVIPAPQQLIQMIRNIPHESEQAFVTKLSGQTIYKRFSKILEQNGIEHMRFHDLRHANASVMLLLNIPDKYAMERLGHATNSTLKNIYQHTMSSERLEIANRINEYFSQLAPKED